MFAGSTVWLNWGDSAGLTHQNSPCFSATSQQSTKYNVNITQMYV